MNTEIINDSEPSAVAPVGYPALWKAKSTGSMWMALSPDLSVCIHRGSGGTAGVGLVDNEPRQVFGAGEFTRLTTPITIKFTP